MDAESQAMFDKLVKVDSEGLNESERGFLLARRDYMNDAQRKMHSKMIDAHEASLKKGTKKGE